MSFLRPSFLNVFPLGFFDGAQQNGNCGAGMVLYLRKDHFVCLSMRLGSGTNTFAELLDHWVLLWFTKTHGILELSVVWDSKVIIKWINGNYALQLVALHSWMERVLEERTRFDYISFRHIFSILLSRLIFSQSKQLGICLVLFSFRNP